MIDDARNHEHEVYIYLLGHKNFAGLKMDLILCRNLPLIFQVRCEKCKVKQGKSSSRKNQMPANSMEQSFSVN
jgi:hypothetical protein